MSRKRALPILIATFVAAPALSAIALQMINGTLRPAVISVSLAVIAAAAWLTYITGRRAGRLERHVARIEIALRVDALDTNRFPTPTTLRRVD